MFTAAVGLVALNLFAGFALSGSDRSGLVRLGGSILAVAGTGAALATFRRSGRLFQGLLALIIGGAATVTGIAITAVKIWKLGVAEYTAVASLAAGVVLLALGSAMIVSEIPRWRRRLIAIPVGLLACYYVLAPLTIAIYYTHLPPTSLSGRTPADLGFAYRNVTMRTTDGLLLAGWYVPSENGAAVVVLHGSGSTRSEMIDHMAAVARHGYGALAIDARGHGESEGVAMDFGWDGELDVEAAVSFLARQPDVDPGGIAVLGLSMGAHEALAAAAGDPRISAVVAEGAGALSFADARSLGLDGWLSLPYYWVAFQAADLMSPTSPPMGLEDTMAEISPRPVLLISRDEGAEAALNQRYRAVAPDSTELWQTPSTHHTKTIWTYPDEWSRRVGDFLDRALAA
jgi:pimeloyl-ACP methyl ester carboxylesterase